MKNKIFFLSAIILVLFLSLFNCDLSEDKQGFSDVKDNSILHDGVCQNRKIVDSGCPICHLRYEFDGNKTGKLIWTAVNFGDGATVSKVYYSFYNWHLLQTIYGTGQKEFRCAANSLYKVRQYGYNPWTNRSYDHECTLAVYAQ